MSKEDRKNAEFKTRVIKVHDGNILIDAESAKDFFESRDKHQIYELQAIVDNEMYSWDNIRIHKNRMYMYCQFPVIQRL